MRSDWLEKLAEEGRIRPHIKEAIYRDCAGLVLDFSELPKTASEIQSSARQIPLEKVASIYADALDVALSGMYGFEKSAISHRLLQRAATRAQELGKDVLRNKFSDEARKRFVRAMDPKIEANYLKQNAGRLEKELFEKNRRIRDLESDVRDKVTQLSRAAEESEKQKKKIEGLSQKSGPTFRTAGNILKNVAVLAPLALAGGVGSGAFKHYMASRDKKKLEQDLKNSFDTAMRMSDPHHEKLHANPERAREAFETLVHFAPGVAMQPSAARNFMSKIVDYGLGIPPEDVKALSDIQKNISQSKPDSTAFLSGFSSGTEALGLGKAVGVSYQSALDT